MRRFIFSCVILCLLVGCGEEVDFDAPPAALSNRPKPKPQPTPDKPAVKPPAQPADNPEAEAKVTDSAVADAQKPEQQAAPASPGEEVAAKPKPEVEAAKPKPDAAASKSNASSQEKAVASASPGQEPADESAKPSATPAEVSEQDKSMAANKSLRANKEVGKGGGFLAALTESPEKKKKPSGINRREAATRAVTRFGRGAVTIKTWLSLQLAMSKRFFVAASDNAGRIAGSTGQRSVDVLSTAVEELGQEFTWVQTGGIVLANTKTKFETTVQPVRNLPAVLRSVGLIDQGDVLLVGTEDGRLLARSCATLQDWDVYSQDLFAFQDEYRPTTRLADEPITAILPLPDSRILSITESGVVQVWNRDDVVQPPKSPLEITKEDVGSTSVKEKSATALFALPLSDHRVLSYALSLDGKQCAIVTADENITIFDVQTGEVVTTLDASQLNDTQPVALTFLEADVIIIGLADGRVVRRALPGGPEISGTDEDGNKTDYEVLYSVETTDQSGPSTAVAVTADKQFLYIGRMDGSLMKYDLPRKSIVWKQKKHKTAILSLASTENGLLTIGEDRVAWLMDIPERTLAPSTVVTFSKRKQKQEREFDLPKDRSLPTKVVTEENSVEGKQSAFTRARNFNNDTSESNAKSVTAVGVRPANPELALLEHRLRVAELQERPAIRAEIRTLRGLEEEAAEQKYEKPRLMGELQTQLDFGSKPFRPLRMVVSNDGTTIAATQPFAKGRARRNVDQPLWVWDIPSQTILRTWRRVSNVDRLSVDWATGRILPIPYTSELSVNDGKFTADQFSGRQLSAVSTDGRIAVGRIGRPGVAGPLLSLTVPGQPAREGLEAFEGIVTALVFSADESTLFVNLREKSRIRLLELDGKTLQVVNVLANEPIQGAWSLSTVNPKTDVVGATHILPGPKGRTLVTYGRYSDQYQLRVWKKSGSQWPQDNVKVISTSDQTIETKMTTTPFAFQNGQARSLVMIGDKGAAILETAKLKITEALPIPDIDGRRPAAILTANGKHLLVGDREGKIWVFTTQNLKREPKSFRAHAAAIAGLALSDDQSCLATVAIENRIRVWDLSEFITD